MDTCTFRVRICNQTVTVALTRTYTHMYIILQTCTLYMTLCSFASWHGFCCFEWGCSVNLTTCMWPQLRVKLYTYLIPCYCIARPRSAKSNNWLNYCCVYDSFIKRNRHGQTCATYYQMSLHAEITLTYVMNPRCFCHFKANSTCNKYIHVHTCTYIAVC